ncbi:hypothetical protein [Bifidobacterium callitrichidarum]|uniref:Uncharacterized protein n=1 Tax=Bifidobacterium callitrichidarum TaxID=2052941 RepID=A0A2U2NC23_9BIFI|nr:hypothetical protein [Bifidobacterium callitrichidarum]PWG66638.1 hypothetical protein DF196_01685 [Bifidobacterium callitrichidarum]
MLKDLKKHILLTHEQSEWLAAQSRRTGSSEAEIIRRLVERERLERSGNIKLGAALDAPGQLYWNYKQELQLQIIGTGSQTLAEQLIARMCLQNIETWIISNNKPGKWDKAQRLAYNKQYIRFYTNPSTAMDDLQYVADHRMSDGFGELSKESTQPPIMPIIDWVDGIDWSDSSLIALDQTNYITRKANIHPIWLTDDREHAFSASWVFTSTPSLELWKQLAGSFPLPEINERQAVKKDFNRLITFIV